MADTSLARKLLIKPGNRILIRPPIEGDTPSLGEMPDGVETVEPPDINLDIVLLFVQTRAQQEAGQDEAISMLRPGGILWVCYPKKTSGSTSDLSREIVLEAVVSTGWRPVTQVAIDDVWSALRMRPETDIKRRRA